MPASDLRSIMKEVGPAALGYAAERFPLRRYAPLSLLFALAGADEASGLRDLLCGSLLSFSFLFQLRLWDDLADLPSDRALHPGRVLSRASEPALRGLRAILAFVVLTNAVILAWSKPFLSRVIVFFALSGALLLWYGGLRRLFRGAATASLVLLAKYPVLVYLAGSSPPSHGVGLGRWLSASLVYLSFCAYELIHDPRARGEKIAIALLGAELVSMVAVSSLLGVVIARRSTAAALIHGAVTIASALGLASLFLRTRKAGALPAVGIGVFLICFLQILSFNLGIRS